MTLAIWWIRRDLRLADNLTLHTALQNSDQLIPLFILDPALLNSPRVGEKRKAFLFAGLRSLAESLQASGSYLIIRQGEPKLVLANLMQDSGATAIYAERDYSPYAIRRDRAISQNLPLQLCAGVMVHPPNTVLKRDGSPYTVFTPYSKTWKQQAAPTLAELLPVPSQIKSPNNIQNDSMPAAPILPKEVPFSASEAEAQRRLSWFVSGANADEPAPISNYAESRNILHQAGTSTLSPYLRFGLISARQVVASAYQAIASAKHDFLAKNAEAWLNELIWREFYITILYHFPYVTKSSFRINLRQIQWVNNQADFEAWCQGKTGYPIVDAAIRQLNQTGWMHNRGRMIVASFLVKDLLIDWRWGEKQFMQQLIDGDPAANNGGWQWTAGTGTDAAPYFRVFNPYLQSQKFDPQGIYIRRWLPELQNVPDQFIHEPHEMSLTMQQQVGCIIGQTYPLPIVDHQWAKERALQAYKAAST